MEIGIYNNHGEKVKIYFKLPRKLKKKMKKVIGEKWQEYKNYHVTSLMRSSLERYF